MTRRVNESTIADRILAALHAQREPIPAAVILGIMPTEHPRSVLSTLHRLARNGELRRSLGKGRRCFYSLPHITPAWDIPPGETRDRAALRELVAALVVHSRVLPHKVAVAMQAGIVALETSDADNRAAVGLPPAWVSRQRARAG